MPRPRKLDKPERVTTAIRFPLGLYQQLRAEAERRRVSVNRLVEWAVGDWLAGKTRPDKDPDETTRHPN